MMIDQCHGKPKIHENKTIKMPLPPPNQRSAYGTYLYFAEPGTLETFMRNYRQNLMDNFQRVRIEGGGEYWTCGQDYDPRNWNYKSWHHLEKLCPGKGLYDFALRDILSEHLGRKLERECQVLYDERELRKRPLKGNSALILTAGGQNVGKTRPLHAN
jgi:hypothetical protein